MIEIVICDDNKDYADSIKKNVKKFFQKENRDINIKLFDEGKKLITYISDNERQVDLVLLDIRMPDYSGFEVAKDIAEYVKGEDLIFISNDDELVYQSFDFKPLGFVRKSKLETRLEYFLNRWLENHPEDSITFAEDGCECTVPVKAVQYINSEKHYVYVHTEEQEYKVRGKLDEFIKMLNSNQFMLCSKSFFVNLSYVKKVTSTDAIMINDVHLPISKANSSECRKIFNRYIRNMYKTER